MSTGKIKCPKCGQEIELSDALRGQIRQELEAEVMRAVKTREDQIADAEKALKKREADVQLQRESVDGLVKQQMAVEAKKMHAGIEKQVRESVGVELQDLQARLAEKETAVIKAQQQELELRKRAREVEDREKALQLEVDRRVDDERKKATAAAKKEADEEHHLKLREKEQMIEDLRRLLDETKRRAEQGSMERQGEVMELALEAMLAREFTTDVFESVAKGVKGGDVIHRVSEGGRDCGIILWESKNAKVWSDKWVAKLKDDQRASGAAIAILVTNVMPDDIKIFGCRDGVWVTRMPEAMAVAFALRRQLVEVAYAHRAAEGKNEKIEILYRHLCGPEFRNRMQAIVESFATMKEQLDQEQRAMTRIWKAREQVIGRVMTNTAGLYGDMQGIIGASMPQIQALELVVINQPKQLASPNVGKRPIKK